MLDRVGEVVGRDGGETLVVLVVVVVLATMVVGIGGRLARTQSLKSQAGSLGWSWVGRSDDFGKLVAAAFPEVVAKAKRSARSGARSSRSNGNGDRARQVAGLALDLSGAGSRVRARVRGRCVANAPTSIGDVAVGELRVSARASSYGRRGGGNRSGNGQSSSSAHCTAAATKVATSPPPMRLAKRTLLGRVTNGTDDTLPDELVKRFDVDDLGPEARAALIDSGAWRRLLTDEVKVQGLRIAKGNVVVMTRRRINRKRARALVGVLEQLVAEMPTSTPWSGDAPGLAAAGPD